MAIKNAVLWSFRRHAHRLLGFTTGPNQPSPVTGPSQPPPQWTKALPFFTALTGNQTSAIYSVDGYNGGVQIEVRNDAGGTGTATLAINGSLDGSHWYPVRYQQIDATGSPTPAVAAIAITATPFAHVYEVLDPWTYLQAIVSGAAPPINVTVAGVAIPLK